MAHLTDDELKDLKTRVVSAMGTGANIGRANDYLLQLIQEVEQHRKGVPAAAPKPKIGKITGADLEVKHVGVPEAPPTTPAPVAENVPTVQISPEETKALVEKTKPEPKPEGKGKGGGKKGDKAEKK